MNDHEYEIASKKRIADLQASMNKFADKKSHQYWRLRKQQIAQEVRLRERQSKTKTVKILESYDLAFDHVIELALAALPEAQGKALLIEVERNGVKNMKL